jgi:hypothetical protein
MLHADEVGQERVMMTSLTTVYARCSWTGWHSSDGSMHENLNGINYLGKYSCANSNWELRGRGLSPTFDCMQLRPKSMHLVANKVCTETNGPNITRLGWRELGHEAFY